MDIERGWKDKRVPPRRRCRLACTGKYVLWMALLAALCFCGYLLQYVRELEHRLSSSRDVPGSLAMLPNSLRMLQTLVSPTIWSLLNIFLANICNIKDVHEPVAATAVLPWAPGNTSAIRIYMYDMDELNRVLWGGYKPSAGALARCRTGMFAAELLIPRTLANSPYITTNPEEADLFLVPYAVTCAYTTSPYQFPPTKTIPRAIQHLKKTSKFYRRSAGTDHVWILTHDFGACMTDMRPGDRYGVPALHASILLVTNGDLGSPCFRVHKDIVIPTALVRTHHAKKMGDKGLLLRKKTVATSQGDMLKLLQPSNVVAQSQKCSCKWAKPSSSCAQGTDDGSLCWAECCVTRPADANSIPPSLVQLRATGKKRNILAFFSGKRWWPGFGPGQAPCPQNKKSADYRPCFDTWYSRGVRNSLYEYAEEHPHRGSNGGGGGVDDLSQQLLIPKRMSREDYIDHVQRSHFCLAPLGFAVWSPRLEESISNGCIPVIISDSFVPPFSDIIDYSAFSVKISQKAVLEDPSIIVRTLKAINVAEREKMRRNVLNTAPFFRYSEMPWVAGDSAVDLIVFELWRKLRRHDLSYSTTAFTHI